MATVSQKITEFPGVPDALDRIAALPDGFLTKDRDPTREIRNLIDELQSAARESRRLQRQAEEERERLRGELLDLREDLGSDTLRKAQIQTLTRDRDMLLGQQSQQDRAISDLKQRLKLAETAAQDAGKLRESTARERKQSQHLLEDAEKKSAGASRQRDDFRQERDLAQKNFTAAQKNIAEVQKALAETRQELAAVKKKGEAEPAGQLDSLRLARDGMSDQITQLKQRITSLEDELAEAAYAREAAEKAARDSKSKPTGIQGVPELQNQLAAAREENRILSENAARLTAEMSAARDGMAAAQEYGTDSTELLEETRALLMATQQQIEAVIRDRDSLLAQLAAHTITFETELTERSAEIERLNRASESSEGRIFEQHEMEVHFEKRRLDMIELNTMLENAHREIRTLSASLAEARLHAKLSGRPVPAASAPVSESRNGGAKETSQTTDEIVAMRRSFQAFSRDQKQIGILGELETHALTITDRAMHGGHPILQCVGTAFANLLGDLLEMPEQISQSTLRTLNQGIEFIALLLSDPEAANCGKLSEARVFVVDDDANTCATEVDALNLVGIHASSALSSTAAIVDLASNQYDLILLDVHMPDLDGFELAAQIRNMPRHAETPIFFVTGDTSLENRVKSSLRGGNEFIAKPFNIRELALKSLKTVITGWLRGRQ